MTTADIDRLAAFCRLADKGYRRDREGDWLDENNFVWDPFGSDDDCRVVMERFYEVASPHQKIDFYQPFVDDDIDGLGAFAERLLLATPAEKCQAVLKVLGDA